MSSHQPIDLGNGKFCYSGPSCKRHGKNSRNKLFRNINDVFNHLDTLYPTKINLQPSITSAEYSMIQKQHLARLTNIEKTVLSMYTENNGSQQINSILRHNNSIPHHLIPVIENLDSSIAKFTNKENRSLFRGINTTPIGWENLKPGDEVEVKEFFSTSASPDIAMNFTKHIGKSATQPILIKILTSEGAPVFSRDNSNYELEFILPRNQKYSVIASNKKANITTGNGTSFQHYNSINMITLQTI